MLAVRKTGLLANRQSGLEDRECAGCPINRLSTTQVLTYVSYRAASQTLYKQLALLLKHFSYRVSDHAYGSVFSVAAASE